MRVNDTFWEGNKRQASSEIVWSNKYETSGGEVQPGVKDWGQVPKKENVMGTRGSAWLKLGKRHQAEGTDTGVLCTALQASQGCKGHSKEP